MLAREEHRREVQVKDPSPIFQALLHDSANARSADVVHQDVDVAMGGDAVRRELLHGSGIGHVARGDVHLETFLLEDGLRLASCVRVDVAAIHPRAFAREENGHRLAVPPARSR